MTLKDCITPRRKATPRTPKITIDSTSPSLTEGILIADRKRSQQKEPIWPT